MGIFDLMALVFSLAAGLGYINYRFIKLPMTIGLTFSALVLSIGIIILNAFGLPIEVWAEHVLAQIDFDKALLQGILSFLLFAGALHIDIEDLHKQRAVVTFLASIGLVVSTTLVGTGVYFLFELFGTPIPFIYCLLFGALISPTDPIAVLAILQTMKVPKSLEIKIAGESLFNDGVGVVIFIALLDVATGAHVVTPSSVTVLFLKEAVGGAVFGFGIGFIVYKLLKNVNDCTLEVLLTLALVMGGYSVAMALHLSAPIAVVVAGLLIGNHGRNFAMSATTKEHLDSFWELLDKLLNAVLFVVIGFEALLVQWTPQVIAIGLIAVAIVLTARFISVSIPVELFKNRLDFAPGTVRILTWGGLRGGISIALALTIPAGPYRELILATTYIVVVFSLFVQGLTMPWLLKKTNS